MLSLYMFYESAFEQNDDSNNNEHIGMRNNEEHNKVSTQPKLSNKVQPGHTFSASEAQDIIDANRQKPQTKTVLNINPKSAAEMMSSSSNSARQAASNDTNNSLNAGQRSASLTGGYINKPQRVPTRLGINPTFNASSI